MNKHFERLFTGTVVISIVFAFFAVLVILWKLIGWMAEHYFEVFLALAILCVAYGIGYLLDEEEAEREGHGKE